MFQKTKTKNKKVMSPDNGLKEMFYLKSGVVFNTFL